MLQVWDNFCVGSVQLNAAKLVHYKFSYLQTVNKIGYDQPRDSCKLVLVIVVKIVSILIAQWLAWRLVLGKSWAQIPAEEIIINSE